MKFTFDKEWLQKDADSDQNLESARDHFLSINLHPHSVNSPTTLNQAPLALSRRKRGWTVEDLAESGGIHASEAIRIERDPS
jgi:hypothetical protein